MSMTVRQAEAEAQWRWGGLLSRGFVRHQSSLRKPFEVGTKRFGVVTIRGSGNSWEGAFQNADVATNSSK